MAVTITPQDLRGRRPDENCTHPKDQGTVTAQQVLFTPHGMASGAREAPRSCNHTKSIIYSHPMDISFRFFAFVLSLCRFVALSL
jgi:hypothetical protein